MMSEDHFSPWSPESSPAFCYSAGEGVRGREVESRDEETQAAVRTEKTLIFSSFFFLLCNHR